MKEEEVRLREQRVEEAETAVKEREQCVEEMEKEIVDVQSMMWEWIREHVQKVRYHMYCTLLEFCLLL